MLELMRNLFQKPKVCFMLAIICLSPIARPLLACPPPDCSAEAADYVNAYTALNTAKERLAEAEVAYEVAKKAVEGAETALKMAYAYYASALLLFEEVWATGNPWLIALALANIIAASAVVAQCMNTLADALDGLCEAIEELNAASNAVITAYLNLIQAWQNYQACLSGG
jgi:hypothetical protein